MNAVEKLEAAIAKLDGLRVDSTPAPWHYWTDDLTGDVDLWHDQEVRSHIATIGHFSASMVYRDAELIVTLHRTIDAQLATLRFALDQANKSGFEYFDHDHEMLLADAILGGGPNE